MFLCLEGMGILCKAGACFDQAGVCEGQSSGMVVDQDDGTLGPDVLDQGAVGYSSTRVV